MTTIGALRLAAALAAAVVVTALAGSIVQTQTNLAAIAGMGAPVPLDVRVATTGQDVVRFGPVMAAIALAAFVPAFAASLVAVRLLPLPAGLVHAVAAALGLWAAFAAMGLVTPMPTLVAAARGATGLAALCATGLLGGWVFSRIAGPASAR